MLLGEQYREEEAASPLCAQSQSRLGHEERPRARHLPWALCPAGASSATWDQAAGTLACPQAPALCPHLSPLPLSSSVSLVYVTSVI